MKTNLVVEMRGFIPFQNEVGKQMAELFERSKEFNLILDFWNWIVEQREEDEDYLHLLAISYNSYRQVTVANRIRQFEIVLIIRENMEFTDHVLTKQERSFLKMIKTRMDEVANLYENGFTAETKHYLNLQSAENQSLKYCLLAGWKTVTELYMLSLPKPKVRAYNTNNKTYVK